MNETTSQKEGDAHSTIAFVRGVYLVTTITGAFDALTVEEPGLLVQIDIFHSAYSRRRS